MSVVVCRWSARINGIDAVDIIHIAVLIVINFIVWDLKVVDPQTVLHFWMGQINAGVDDSDYDLCLRIYELPCFWGIDIDIRDPARLTFIMEIPLLMKSRIDDGRIHRSFASHSQRIVGLSIKHILMTTQAF